MKRLSTKGFCFFNYRICQLPESASEILGLLLILSLLLFRESDGVEVVDEKQWISLLIFEHSLALLDLL